MNISQKGYQRLTTAIWLLKICYGLFFITVGIDKYFNFIVAWPKYIHPFFLQFVEASILDRFFGIIEIFCGVLMFTQWAWVSAWGMLLGLITIAINLAFMRGYLDIAARDVVIAVGVFTLILLMGAQEEVQS